MSKNVIVCCCYSSRLNATLMNNIKEMKASYYASDYWKSYEDFIPAEKHLQTKAEIFTVEGYNSRIRHYLARFKRKEKCDSKSYYMIEISLNLLMLKLNNKLTILN